VTKQVPCTTTVKVPTCVTENVAVCVTKKVCVQVPVQVIVRTPRLCDPCGGSPAASNGCGTATGDACTSSGFASAVRGECAAPFSGLLGRLFKGRLCADPCAPAPACTPAPSCGGCN